MISLTCNFLISATKYFRSKNRTFYDMNSSIDWQHSITTETRKILEPQKSEKKQKEPNERTNVNGWKQIFHPHSLQLINAKKSFIIISVTRLGDFWKFLGTKFLAKEAQILSNNFGTLWKMELFASICVDTFWATFVENWATYFSIWSHWSSCCCSSNAESPFNFYSNIFEYY